MITSTVLAQYPCQLVEFLGKGRTEAARPSRHRVMATHDAMVPWRPDKITRIPGAPRYVEMTDLICNQGCRWE